MNRRLASNLSWLNDRYTILSKALYCIPLSVALTPVNRNINTTKAAIRKQVNMIKQRKAWDNTHASTLFIME